MAHFTHHSEENYLKALYHLQLRSGGNRINNTALSRQLDLNPATVLEMVRKLVSKDLVEMQPDKSLQLTPNGKKRALLIIRRHRLWEVFLVNKLKYRWNEVHELAEELEHIDSEDMINRLEAFLGFPSTDPHGDPIPDREARVRSASSVPLNEATIGKSHRVLSLADTNDDFLTYLDKLAIRPGIRIKLLAQNAYDKSFSIRILQKEHQISEKIAMNILVEA